MIFLIISCNTSNFGILNLLSVYTIIYTHKSLTATLFYVYSKYEQKSFQHTKYVYSIKSQHTHHTP